MTKVKIAIFASGNGTNAQKIIEYSFVKESLYSVQLIYTNNSKAGILNVANKFNLYSHFEMFNENTIANILAELRQNQVEYIVLAGFLKRIPYQLIQEFSGRIVNIHPSLLPKYGGKGMYGINVHKEVLKNHEQETGITIHLVNQEYDKGKILFQKSIDIKEYNSPEEIQRQVQKLEHKYYPLIIDKLVEKKRSKAIK